MEEAPASILDIWLLYEQVVRSTNSSSKAIAILAQSKSALFRYTLPGLGFSHPQGKGLTRQEAEAAQVFMQQLSPEQLVQVATAQQQVFDDLEIAKQTQRTYRHALHRFLRWCSEQPWCTWPLEKQPLPRGRQKQDRAPLPRITQRLRTDEKGNHLYSYQYSLEQLPDEQIPDQLNQELKAFHQFRIAPGDISGISPVKEATASTELRLIRLILGWQHFVKEIPLDKLSLKQLLPMLPPVSENNKTESIQHSTDLPSLVLMYEYLNWLQKRAPFSDKAVTLPPRSQSLHTRAQIIKLFLTISKFMYRQVMQQDEQQYRRSPVVYALMAALSVAEQRASRQPSANLSEQKLLQKDQLKELVESLRRDCSPQREYSTHTLQKKTRLSTRSLSAIAFSYQRFLLAAFMSYLPPQRPYYYWALLVQQPSQQKPKQAESESLNFSGFLSQQGEKWFVHWQQGRQLKNDVAQMGELEIPNRAYEDDRCFYDYLHEWLIEFSYKGEALSGGLRSVFQPTHDFFFTKRNGQPYQRANDFKHLLRTPAYQQTGQAPTPITIKLLFDRNRK